MSTTNASRRGQRGFSLVEALIALVVVAFGILSLAGMQLLLSRSADVSKQRTEAVRLAQEKMEELRSFSGISGTALANDNTNPTSNVLNWAVFSALPSSSDVITTNAAYTRTWTVGPVTGIGGVDQPLPMPDLGRAFKVEVKWTDRAGEEQTVDLSSVISKTDPADAGYLGFPLPQNTNLKRPKNRNLDIPIPAIDLNNGNSAVRFGSSGQYLQFSNISGDVVLSCSPVGLGPNPTTAQIITALTTAGSANCSPIKGYILAGYISRSLDQSVGVSNTDWNAIQGGLGLDVSGITRNAAGTSGIACQFGDATDQTTGANIPNFKYYICVIPLEAPNTPLTTNGPYNWSGTVKIAGPAVWHGANNKYYVCRYQYSTTAVLTDPNQRNVQPYVNVNRSIDQQNYLILTTGNATSPETPVCPASMNTADISSGASISTGVLHQDCRSASNQTYGTACPLLGVTPNTYTVTYAANGATGGTPPVDQQSPYASGSTVTVLGNPGNLVLTGKNFSGWSLAADGSGDAYQAGAPIGNLTANTTLYAKWTTGSTYTVTYNANGGAGTLIDTNSPYAEGSNVVILNGTSLTRSGYNFIGWTTAPDGSGATYLAGSTLNAISANTTLYAKWNLITNFTVTYNGNSATSGTAPTDTSVYLSGSTVTVKSGGNLMRTGYSFNGWNTATNESGTSYAVDSTFEIFANTTLYARWNQLPLSAPLPRWPNGNSKNLPTLSWSAVPSAVDYMVNSCTSTGTVACIFDSSTSQTTTEITPPVVTGTQQSVWCYGVIARGAPFADSPSSAKFCAFRASNGDYTRSP